MFACFACLAYDLLACLSCLCFVVCSLVLLMFAYLSCLCWLGVHVMACRFSLGMLVCVTCCVSSSCFVGRVGLAWMCLLAMSYVLACHGYFCLLAILCFVGLLVCRACVSLACLSHACVSLTCLLVILLFCCLACHAFCCLCLLVLACLPVILVLACLSWLWFAVLRLVLVFCWLVCHAFVGSLVLLVFTCLCWLGVLLTWSCLYLLALPALQCY